MYSMKQVCEQADIAYETLRFYCKEGLVPNVLRDQNNYRVFDERNISWIRGLACLRKCGMGISDMKAYMQLCLKGQPTIPARKALLAAQREQLIQRARDIQESIDYIDRKQAFYDGVMAGEIAYSSSLLRGD